MSPSAARNAGAAGMPQALVAAGYSRVYWFPRGGRGRAGRPRHRGRQARPDMGRGGRPARAIGFSDADPPPHPCADPPPCRRPDARRRCAGRRAGAFDPARVEAAQGEGGRSSFRSRRPCPICKTQKPILATSPPSRGQGLGRLHHRLRQPARSGAPVRGADAEHADRLQGQAEVGRSVGETQPEWIEQLLEKGALRPSARNRTGGPVPCVRRTPAAPAVVGSIGDASGSSPMGVSPAKRADKAAAARIRHIFDEIPQGLKFEHFQTLCDSHGRLTRIGCGRNGTPGGGPKSREKRPKTGARGGKRHRTKAGASGQFFRIFGSVIARAGEAEPFYKLCIETAPGSRRGAPECQPSDRKPCRSTSSPSPQRSTWPSARPRAQIIDRADRLPRAHGGILDPYCDFILVGDSLAW